VFHRAGLQQTSLVAADIPGPAYHAMSGSFTDNHVEMVSRMLLLTETNNIQPVPGARDTVVTHITNGNRFSPNTIISEEAWGGIVLNTQAGNWHLPGSSL
jgi:hypothetical protein